MKKESILKKLETKLKKGFTLIELLAVIIILGILMIITIPSVTEYVNSSRKKAYVITAKEYVTAVRNKVNNLEYEFMDTDTTYYVPISCVNLEKGGDSPFGEWRDAYVIVVYDGNSYQYYWTSLDSSGYKVDITNVNDLDVSDLVPSSYAIEHRVGIEGRKWVAIVEEDTCQVGAVVEAESNFGNNYLANVVKVGDFVNYDAGVWDKTVVMPTSGFSFGGYTAGTSRNNSVSCAGETSLYNGWRVIEVKDDTVKLIHAGSSECYYHPHGTDYACISKYILTNDKSPVYGYCANSSLYEGHTSRDWNEYLDSRYASNVTSVSWRNHNIYDVAEIITYENAEAFVAAYPNYSFVLTSSSYSTCTTFSVQKYSDLIDNGAKGNYWLGFGMGSSLDYDFENFSCDLSDKEYNLYTTMTSDLSNVRKGIRPVVTLKANVKTSGQVEQVVGTDGKTMAMVWQLVE